MYVSIYVHVYIIAAHRIVIGTNYSIVKLEDCVLHTKHFNFSANASNFNEPQSQLLKTNQKCFALRERKNIYNILIESCTSSFCIALGNYVKCLRKKFASENE